MLKATICGRSVHKKPSTTQTDHDLDQVVTGLILFPVVQEFGFKGPFLKLAQNIGLLVGAAFWGLISDVYGRRCVMLYLDFE